MSSSSQTPSSADKSDKADNDDADKSNSDSFITQQPQFTHFKKNINRHTNFTNDYHINTFDSSANWGMELSSTMSKFGDLLGKCYIVVQLNKSCVMLDDDDMLELYADEIVCVRQNMEIRAKLRRHLEDFMCLRKEAFDAYWVNNKAMLSAIGVDNGEEKGAMEVLKRIRSIVYKELPITSNVDKFTQSILDLYFGKDLDTKQSMAKTYFNLHCFLVGIDYINIVTELKSKTTDIIPEYNDINTPGGVDTNYSTYHSVLGRKHQIKILRQREIDHPYHAIRARLINIRYNRRLDNYILKSVKVSIADTTIDTLTIHQLRMTDGVSSKSQRSEILNMTSLTSDEYSSGAQYIYIPLDFWWTRSTTQYLPIVALRYHDVVIDVIFNDFEKVVDNTAREIAILQKEKHRFAIDFVDGHIMSEYIYLSTDERNRFCSQRLEYVVESHSSILQVVTNVNYELDFDFAHSTKELYWAVWNSRDDTYIPLERCQILFTSEYKTDVTNPLYFSTVQPWSFESSGGTNQFFADPTIASFHYLNFSLSPDQHQPSGSCSIGEIPHKQLHIRLPVSYESLVAEKVLHVFMSSRYINILSIEHGMTNLTFNASLKVRTMGI